MMILKAIQDKYDIDKKYTIKFINRFFTKRLYKKYLSVYESYHDALFLEDLYLLLGMVDSNNVSLYTYETSKVIDMKDVLNYNLCISFYKNDSVDVKVFDKVTKTGFEYRHPAKDISKEFIVEGILKYTYESSLKQILQI